MLSHLIPRRHTMLMTQPLTTVVLKRRDTWWTWLGRVFGGRERILRIEHITS